MADKKKGAKKDKQADVGKTTRQGDPKGTGAKKLGGSGGRAAQGGSPKGDGK